MIIFKNFFYHVLIFLFSVFFVSQYINKLSILYFNINITIVTTVLLFIFTIVYAPFVVYQHRSKINIYIMSIVSVIIFLTLLYLFYSFYSASLEKFIKVTSYICTFFISYMLVYKNLLNKFLFYIVMVSIISLGVIFSDLNLFLSSIMTATRGQYDVSPLNISSLSLMTGLILFLLFRIKNNKIYLLFSLIFFIISFSGASKGPLVSFFIAIFFGNYLIDKNKIKTILISVSILVLSYLVVLILVFNEVKIAERFLGVNNSNNVTSIDSRIGIYSSTINKIFSDNIVFGSGVDNFKNDFEGFTYPHNIFLELSYEIGLIVTVFIVFILGYIFIFKRFYMYNHLYSALFIYLLLEAQFSHDLSFLRNILFIYFILMWSYEKQNNHKTS